ncbi:zinc finger BED domain-containing protein RICESLEEPER 2-like [Papaver somniferum]|uniref:zinc finger BED domain-containing protein RICESLEEPER 2-like n=1 Tax=Papaver somniferum TaxID=3469 RepID=UPI000E703963|nr:zinc finger BED domain-containing protein RICESLEEPER 2-like [Papaver somniferum]
MEPATKKPVPKPKKLRSLVWNDFERVKRGDTMAAICKHCKNKLNGASTSGTTHLKNHLLRCPVKNNLGDTNAGISYGKRLTSLVWNDFERVKRGDAMVAICKHCKRKLNGASTNGTTHLKNHLLRCPLRNSLASASDTTQRNLLQIYPLNNNVLVREEIEDGSVEPDSLIPDEDPIPQHIEQSRVDLARMIILHDYPLNMVEHIGFKRFVENLQPSFCFTSDTVMADCMQIYGIEKQRVYEILDEVPGQISVTASTWTSGQDHVYLCLTAHYIDVAWLLQKKILNFVMIDPDTEETLQLSETIITCINDWGIDSKLLSLALDNYSTSDDVASRVKERLPHNRLLPRNDLFHVCCAEHILNVIVQELLGALHDVIHKIRECVRYVKSSESLQQNFNDLYQGLQVTTSHKNLCLDSPTRWKSTYLMLEAAVGNRIAFSHFQECDSNYVKISNSDWERVTAVTNYLKLFVEVLNVFSGAKSPTANLYFPEVCDIHVQLIEWCKSSDSVICSVALKMKEKFDIYWSVCIRLLTIAAILDPRFKMKLVEYYYPQIYGGSSAERISDISKCIKDLYEEYTNKSMAFSSLDHGYACEGQSSGLSAALSCVDNGSKDRLSGYNKFVHETADTQYEKSELDKYLDEPVFPTNIDFNILNWWKVNSPKYPVLSMVARDVLGIPMSTAVTSYSANNDGDRVLATHWSPLSSDVIQAMICTHDWLQTELEA